MQQTKERPKGKVKGAPIPNDENVGPRYSNSYDLPNYDPRDPTPAQEQGDAEPPHPYDRRKEVQKAGLGSVIKDAWGKIKHQANPDSGSEDMAAIEPEAKDLRHGGPIIRGVAAAKDILGFENGGIVSKTETLPAQKGHAAITFQKGGLHASTGTPAGQKIPQAKRAEAASGKLGAKAQKQEQFAENVLHAKGGAVVAKAKEGSKEEEAGESKAEEAKEDAKGKGDAKDLKKAKKGAMVMPKGKGANKNGAQVGMPPAQGGALGRSSADMLSAGFRRSGMY